MTQNKKKKIMLVEDNYTTVETLFDRLSFEGYDITIAYDGQECLDKIKHDSPDLIILDLMMPRIDGFEVIRRIRANRAYDHVDIIVSSAKDSIEDLDLVESMGVQGYAAKPYRSADLLEQIELSFNGKLNSELGFRESKIKTMKKQFKA